MAIFSIIAAFMAKGGVGIFLKLFRGISGPILEYKKNQAVQGTKRQGIWAHALEVGAQADVEHRKQARMERANSPALMALYIAILFWPILYFSLYWADTIFAGQVWRINFYFFEWKLWNWEKYVLPAAPDDLVEYGKWVIGVFIGANVATSGIVKGAKILQAAGLMKGK